MFETFTNKVVMESLSVKEKTNLLRIQTKNPIYNI